MLWELSWLFYNKFVVLYAGPVGLLPGCSGTGGKSTEVETDVPASKRRVVVTRRSIPLAGDGRRSSRSSVPVLERSRELLEQAFDNDMAIFPKMYPPCNVPSGSTFTRTLVLDELSADPANTVIRATGHQPVTLCKAVCGE